MKMEALEVLKNRRSVRAFKPDQIKEEELNAVLEAGTYAPTGGGTQSPLIIAVQTPENVAKVDALNAKIIGKDMHPYYGAPTILLILATERAMNPEIGTLDAASVCTNLLNAAYAVGLDACWIHRSKQMFETEEGKALLAEWGVTEPVTGVASIALGYRDCEIAPAKERREDFILKV